MSLLALAEVSFGYSNGPALFGNASFSIHSGDRIAVVGANGAGKSTLLRLVAGELEPSSGVVIRRRGLKMATAGQDSAEDAGLGLLDFAYDPASALGSLHLRLREPVTDPLDYANLLSRYEEEGGYRAETVVERTLEGLGYSRGEFGRPVGSLSGGERTRARLARALSAGAELLILDEPTNHLDLAGAGVARIGAGGARGRLSGNLARPPLCSAVSPIALSRLNAAGCGFSKAAMPSTGAPGRCSTGRPGPVTKGSCAGGRRRNGLRPSAKHWRPRWP